uniref:Uncharacterized protein n=1 Tax=Kalanchoe fedtschenkoi TaxID=63787 RepID=A0A7N0V4A3_KALFE
MRRRRLLATSLLRLLRNPNRSTRPNPLLNFRPFSDCPGEFEPGSWQSVEGLVQCSANYAPLSPISFLERAARVYEDRVSVPKDVQQSQPNRPLSDEGGGRQNAFMQFNSSEAAAEAAADAAKKAIAAAEAAAYLANREPNHVNRRHTLHSTCNASSIHPSNLLRTDHQPGHHNNMHQPQRFGRSQSHFTSSEETKSLNRTDGRKVSRRQSYNDPRQHSDIKFDDSGSEEESETEEDHHPGTDFHSAPARPAPAVPSSSSSINKHGTAAPHTHPNLPDYDSLAARFEALKYQRK